MRLPVWKPLPRFFSSCSSFKMSNLSTASIASNSFPIVDVSWNAHCRSSSAVGLFSRAKLSMSRAVKRRNSATPLQSCRREFVELRLSISGLRCFESQARLEFERARAEQAQKGRRPSGMSEVDIGVGDESIENL